MTLTGYCGRAFDLEAVTPVQIEGLGPLPSYVDVGRPGADWRRFVVEPGQVLELEAEPGTLELWIGPGARAVIGEEAAA